MCYHYNRFQYFFSPIFCSPISVIFINLQTFAIRFANSEITKEFKEAFMAGQSEMTALLAGEDSKEGKEQF